MDNQFHNSAVLRPKWHFTPAKGWMNDPNGPVFYQGEYHLFFQHDPDALVWNTMHWGHARSKDLIHWEQLPIALFPDEQGVIYSGCAFVDEENVSGFGSKASPALLLFYTSHNMQTMREMQCLAYTLDCVHFRKYAENPIVPGKDHTPARDPQVFRNTIRGGYSMMFTRENAVDFYHSEDLLHWEKSGEFVLAEYALHGMIECPCMFKAEVEETEGGKNEKYVLMLSMDVPDTEFGKFPEEALPHHRTMQYFTGMFDGSSFAVDKEQNKVLLVDYGPDFYAGTIFANVKDTILISWLGDFSEGARKTPTEQEGFRGILSYPRKLTLVRTEDGYRLHHEFFPEPGCFLKEPDHGITYTKSEDEVILQDGCVREIVRNDGLLPITAYTWYNK